MGETITLSETENRRLMVLNKVVGGELSARQGAEVIGVSGRQLRRILAAYREEGAAGLVHGNRGRRPANTIGQDVRDRVVELARTRYSGYNHQHLTEELNESEQMGIDRSSVRRIMLASGMASPRRRRPPKHRARRERYAQEGMLLQIDGSRHDWLEGRGPLLTLVGAIDDATGTVPFGLFRCQEDSAGYFLLIKGVLGAKGIPLAVYRDRHGIFEVSSKGAMSLEEELSGKREPTQFGRLLEELGITSIPARSPQAKGRIERLWGTFQDRLVSELRRAGASSLDEADLVLSAFLPRFNSRFAVPAAVEGSAYRALPPHLDAGRLFCFKYRRVVGADNTIRFGQERIQLLPSQGRVSYVRAQVEVCEHLDGAISVYYQDKLLATREAPAEAPLLRARKGVHRTAAGAAQSEARDTVERARPDGKPSTDHPWRRKSLKMRMAQLLAEPEYGTVG